MPLDYERGLDRVWIYGALCVRDGQVLTQTAPSRNTLGDLALLRTLDRTYTDGDLYLVADNLASHLSGPIRDWLADRPRIHHAFIPVGAAWLNLIEGWWRLFRRKAFAGESLADADDIAYVTDLATAQLNRHAQPWVWGRPAPPHPTPPPLAALLRVPSLRNDAVYSFGVGHRGSELPAHATRNGLKSWRYANIRSEIGIMPRAESS